MSRTRQNLTKRMVHVARRSLYNAMRASFGPEWERLRERRGLPPCLDADTRSMVLKLRTSSMYGKFSVPV